MCEKLSDQIVLFVVLFCGIGVSFAKLNIFARGALDVVNNIYNNG